MLFKLTLLCNLCVLLTFARDCTMINYIGKVQAILMYLASDKKPLFFILGILLTCKEQTTFTKQYAFIVGSVIKIYYKQFKSMLYNYTPNNGLCYSR